MIPVDQTTFGKLKGNCFQAVIASLLELSLDDVPHFCEDAVGPEWWEPFMTWLSQRGFSAVELDMDLSSGWCPNEGQLCWLVGRSPRNKDCKHAVVGELRNGIMCVAHDPHPSRDGIAGTPHCIGVLIPLNPKEST